MFDATDEILSFSFVKIKQRNILANQRKNFLKQRKKKMKSRIIFLLLRIVVFSVKKPKNETKKGFCSIIKCVGNIKKRKS